MANYYAMWRTNYFKVEDKAAFLKWVELIYDTPNVRFKQQPDGAVLAVMYAGDQSDFGGIPCQRDDGDGNEVEDFDFCMELGAFLALGEVAIVMEAGHEKARYVCGHAIAVIKEHDGDVGYMSMRLSDIYRKVREEWGITPNAAEY
jgi:hypothetical protein